MKLLLLDIKTNDSSIFNIEKNMISFMITLSALRAGLSLAINKTDIIIVAFSTEEYDNAAMIIENHIYEEKGSK